jgi:DNA-binding CsgD family transcriptional regulator/tetratricopeptide (TPR) repeat protein
MTRKGSGVRVPHGPPACLVRVGAVPTAPIDELVESDNSDVDSEVVDRIEQGRAALRAGDASRARAAVSSLDPARGDVLEILARAEYLDLAFGPAIEHWERAYAAYRSVGDQLGAIRVARTVAGMHSSILGQFAVSAGWLSRAQTLLATVGDTSERGWVALNAGMFEPDRPTKHARFSEALTIARASGDQQLEVAALAYLGASLVHGDDVARGMQLLDEALAAVAGDEVDDFCVLEEVFCQLFSACEHARDVTRADQWIHVGEAIAARRGLPAVSAFCRTHYGAVLTVAGRWPEADSTLTEAIQLWALGQRSSILRGGALVRLADLRVRQGRYEEAAALLADLHPMNEREAARPLAAIHLARGESAIARDLLERALEPIEPESAGAAPLLEVLVEVLIVDGDAAAAERAADQLVAASRRHASPYLRAAAALARGRVCLATGAGDARACLREALDQFSRTNMPLELARARLELATAIASEQPAVALTEARAALDVFERLRASRHTDQATALLRKLGVRLPVARTASAGPLTGREAEVLDLVGAGFSNSEIAERLYISRKTVEHHVSNVLAKLGLRSRAEAAAWAVRHSSVVSEPASE